MSASQRKGKTGSPPSPKPLRERAREAARAAIVRAAQAQFSLHGYQATKMTDIAREAGVAAGTLYNYFPSKEAVFEEIVRVEGHAMLETLEARVSSTSDPVQALQVLIHELLRTIEENRQLYAILVQVHGSALCDPQTDSQRAEIQLRDRFAALAGEVLQRAQSTDGFSDYITEDLLSALFGLCNGFLDTWIRAGQTPGLCAKSETIFNIFLQGVRNRD